MRGIFVNTNPAQCSIHESGKMVYDILKKSKKYSLDYRQLLTFEEMLDGYDFSIINWHYHTMPMDTSRFGTISGLKIAMVLEASLNDPFVRTPTNFDEYIVLDPAMHHVDKRVRPFPRPLEIVDVPPYQEPEVPVIGTFGFATPGKGFDLVVGEVNSEFQKAIVRINIPSATFADYWGTVGKKMGEVYKAMARQGIEVQISHDYMTKEQLIKWCSQNTINVFLYYRGGTGLSATTDQAISSGRPLLVSDCVTFRHIHPYIAPYPRNTIRQAISNSLDGIKRMRDEWSHEKFLQCFEKVLLDRGLL